jgi:hypothetical protein
MSCIVFPRFVGPVYIDAVISEKFSASMEVPTHPVERGAKISDHAWILPQTLEMVCLNQDMTGPLRALVGLMEEAEPFDILSGFDLHESFMITAIEANRDAIYGNVLSHTVTLTEINIVESQEGPAQSDTTDSKGKAKGAKGGDERGASKTDRGPVATKPVDTSVGRGASVAATLSAPPILSGVAQ